MFICSFLSYCDHLVYQTLYRITTASFAELARALEIHDQIGPTKDLIRENTNLCDQVERKRPENGPQVGNILKELFKLVFNRNIFAN